MYFAFKTRDKKPRVDKAFMLLWLSKRFSVKSFNTARADSDKIFGTYLSSTGRYMNNWLTATLMNVLPSNILFIIVTPDSEQILPPPLPQRIKFEPWVSAQLRPSLESLIIWIHYTLSNDIHNLQVRSSVREKMTSQAICMFWRFLMTMLKAIFKMLNILRTKLLCRHRFHDMSKTCQRMDIIQGNLHRWFLSSAHTRQSNLKENSCNCRNTGSECKITAAQTGWFWPAMGASDSLDVKDMNNELTFKINRIAILPLQRRSVKEWKTT